MPQPADVRPEDVRAELTDILGQVVGSAPQDVVDHARLQDLGVDSLAVVEVADEMGRRFDVYLSDEAVNSLRTVSDAVAAVVRHDGAGAPRSITYQDMVAPTPADAAPPAPGPIRSSRRSSDVDDEERKGAFQRLGWWFAAIGAAAGIVFGLAFVALIGATGLTSSDLPPLVAPTTPAPTIATPTPTPTTAPDPEASPDSEPTLTIPTTEVNPGERFALEGAFPALGGGEELQVQVKDPGEAWDEFPVTTESGDGGEYRTEIYTSRTGEREFRMAHEASDTYTPAVRVRIG